MTPIIQVLPQDVINEIAAGEVVQNPASVVKELIDNAIDAKSSEIYIEIQNAGKDKIIIIDNGIGMSEQNLHNCCKKHATSKISAISDIYCIKSLGMRGEALFAIDSVSHLTIISKTNETDYGLKYFQEKIEKTAANNGTMIIIENLFYNTPARLKFLKNNHYETQAIENIIETYAVCYPNILFKFNKNGTYILYTNPIKQAFDYNFSDGITISFNQNSYYLSGLLLPGIISNKNMIFVNKRPIKDKKITAIVKKSFQEISGKENIPFILFIDCPFDAIDVNVHPAKTEIRFADNQIYSYVFQGIRQSFAQSQLTTLNGTSPTINNPYSPPTTAVPPAADDFKQLQQLKESFHHGDLIITDITNENIQLKEQKHLLFAQINPYIDLIPMGQIFYRYIVCTKDNQMILIDQHAAHERIVAENFKNQIVLQHLVIPIVFKINFNYESLQQLTEIMEFTMDQNNIIITAIPSIFSEKHIEDFFINHANTEFFQNPKAFVYQYIHNYGCKNAIKSGQILQLQEMQELIKTLQNTPNHLFCNHGRRILITFALSEIDKLFGRVNFTNIDNL